MRRVGRTNFAGDANRDSSDKNRVVFQPLAAERRKFLAVGVSPRKIGEIVCKPRSGDTKPGRRNAVSPGFQRENRWLTLTAKRYRPCGAEQ